MAEARLLQTDFNDIGPNRKGVSLCTREEIEGLQHGDLIRVTQVDDDVVLEAVVTGISVAAVNDPSYSHIVYFQLLRHDD